MEALHNTAEKGGNWCFAWSLGSGEALHREEACLQSVDSGSCPEGAHGRAMWVDSCICPQSMARPTGVEEWCPFDILNTACLWLTQKALLALMRSQRQLHRPRPLPRTLVLTVSIAKELGAAGWGLGGCGNSGMAPPMPHQEPAEHEGHRPPLRYSSCLP